jgi:hypothetical protein
MGIAGPAGTKIFSSPLWSRFQVSFYAFHVPWHVRKGRAKEILELILRDTERVPKVVLHDVLDISSADMNKVAAEFDLGIFEQGRPNLTKVLGTWFRLGRPVGLKLTSCLQRLSIKQFEDLAR